MIKWEAVLLEPDGGGSLARRLVLILLFTAVLGGCGGGDSVTKPPPGLRLPTTPDEFVSEFRRAYNDRDLDTLQVLFSPDFVFYFSPGEVDTVGVDPEWGKVAEFESMTTMFAGSTGVRPDGSEQASVDLQFSFGLFFVPEDSAWIPRDDPPFDGTLFRTFRVGMQVQYVDGSLDLVSGFNEFFVEEITVEGSNGASGTGYVLRAWRDRSTQPPTRSRSEALLHNTSWGYVKALFAEHQLPQSPD